MSIQLRRDKATSWTSTNPTLAEGEFGMETDTGKIKIGDGTNNWTSLNYLATTDSPPDWSSTTQQAKLQSSDIADYDRLGTSVALDPTGDVAIVGAIFEDEDGDNSGSAYIFTRDGTTWTQQIKLTPTDNDRGSNDQFGWCADIGTNTAIVGSHRLTGTDTGAAYVFIAG